MSEIMTPLLAATDDDGEHVYTITAEHTFADVIRHLISEGATLADFTVTWRHEAQRRAKLS